MSENINVNLSNILHSIIKKINVKSVIYGTLSVIPLLSVASNAEAATTQLFYIDPSATTNGTGTQTSPYNSWVGISFAPGGVYLQKRGTTFNSSFIMSGVGTALAPIQMGAYGTGAAPAIHGSVVFQGAKYVTLTGMNFTGSPYGAVILQSGTQHVTVIGNSISNSLVGVWIGNGAGGSNLISQNVISGCLVEGIAIDNVSNPTGQETTIQANFVSQNGSHGIEIGGNNFIVKGNYFVSNGLTISGSSAIHVFGTKATYGTGSYNAITNNVVISTNDKVANDGNGIELDQWTHDNSVSNNFALGNDGAGIIVYDSFHNTVTNNTLIENAVDSGASHSLKGELVVSSQFSTGVSFSENNQIRSNTVVAANVGATAVLIDNHGKPDSNVFGSNVYENLPGGNVFSWAWVPGKNVAVWRKDALNATTDSFSGIPVKVVAAADSATLASLSFQFPASIQSITVDGASLKFLGWSATSGLIAVRG